MSRVFEMCCVLVPFEALHPVYFCSFVYVLCIVMYCCVMFVFYNFGHGPLPLGQIPYV